MTRNVRMIMTVAALLVSGSLSPRGYAQNRIDPFLFSLPHSKFCFTIESVIDLTNCREAEDVYHTDVEVPVTAVLGDWIEYYNASGEILLEDFLLKFDSFFKKTLELIERPRRIHSE
jgi:hypothetical protein